MVHQFVYFYEEKNCKLFCRWSFNFLIKFYRWFVMFTPLLESHFQQTRGMMLPKFSVTLMLLPRYHGMYILVTDFEFNFLFLPFCFQFLETLLISHFILCTMHEINTVIQLNLLFSGFTNRYGIEQEYTLLQKDVNWPLGWPLGGFPGPQVWNVTFF